MLSAGTEAAPLMAKSRVDREAEAASSYYDLSTLPESEARRLRERLKANHGVMRIFVHPFYVTPAEMEITRQLAESSSPYHGIDRERLRRWRAVGKAVKKYLREDAFDTPPICIMEAQSKIPDAISQLGNDVKNPPYVIPTYQDTPTPFFPRYSKDDSQPPFVPEAAERSWLDLIEKLKLLGVTNIIIGGMNFSVHESPQKGYPYQISPDSPVAGVDQCVGFAASRLAQNFKVDISLFSYPHTRADIHRRVKRPAAGTNTAV